MLLALGLATAAGSAAVRAQDASQLYEQALTEFRGDNLESSVVSLRAALKQDPGLLPAYVLLARVYLRILEPAAASDALRKARRLGADPSIVWPLRAEAMLAERKLGELVSLAPQDGLDADAQSKVLVLKGMAHLEMQKFDLAEESFGLAAALTPSSSDPLVAHAVAALRQGNPFVAEARAIKATRVAPQDANAWNVLGDVMHVQGRLTDALQAYGSALRIDPEHHDARMSRAGLYIDLGQLDQAAKDISYIRKKYPLDARAAYLESVQLAKQGRKAQAREALKRAAALLEELGAAAIGESSQLMLLAGVAAFELGAFEQAQGYLSAYLEKFPNQPGPRRLLGTILLRNERPEEAIVVLERAIALSPDDTRLLELLASAYMATERHDLATGYLEKAVKLSGGAPKLRARLALSRLGSGFGRQGMRELRAIFAEDPKRRPGVGTTLATLLFKNGEYAEAAAVAARVREVQPRNLTVLNLLASAQLRAGLRDEARVSYEEALGIDPDFLPAKVNLGKMAAARGRHSEARAIFMEILAKRPNNVPTMIAVARVEQDVGNHDESLRWLQKAQGTDAKSIPVALALADHYLLVGEFQEAQRVARDAENMAPEDMDVLEAVARTQIAQDRLDVAANIYRRMSRIAGFNTDHSLRIARLQLALGESAEAVFTLRKGLKNDPSHHLSRLLLIALLTRNGKLEEALKQVTALLSAEPDLPDAHRLAGDVNRALGRYSDALKHFSSAFELAPTSQHALRLYGTQMEAGDDGGAAKLLQDWLTGNPKDAAAHLALAQNHLRRGQLEKARARYEKVLELNPFDAAALNNMAYVLDKQDSAEALEYAERAVRLSPDDPAILDTLGWMLVRRGRSDQGLKYLRDAHSRAAGNPEIRYHIASALVALNRTEEAKVELRRALQISDQFEGVDEARRMLEKLSR